MNPCDSIQPELKAYLDGQLPFMLRQRVRRHLNACAACREELSAMEQISTELHTDTPKPLESSLRDRILHAVNQSDAPSASQASAANHRRQRMPLLVGGAAATALIAWLTLYPLMHGDMLHSLAAQRRQSESETAVSQLKAVAPPAPASAMPSGRATRAAAHTPAAAPSLPVSTLASGSERAKTMYMAAQAAVEEKRPVENDPVAGSYATPITPVLPLGMKKRMAAADLYETGREQSRLDSLAGEEKLERQVHREATLSVQVDNVEAKSETATQYVLTAGGFVASNELNTGEDNLKTASLSLKVPVAQFERVLGQVTKLGDVKSKNITGEDLTEQLSDQQQAEHILRQDIDTTQEELAHRLTKTGRQERLDTLRELRTRIAQTQARLKLLRKLGALSTITLELTEKPRPVPPPAPKTGGFIGDMNDTLHAAGQSMLQAARLPILTFIWILAYSPLWILLVLGYRYAVRR